MPEPSRRAGHLAGRRAACVFASLGGLGVLVRAAVRALDLIPDGPRPGRHEKHSPYKMPVPRLALGQVRALPQITPAADFPQAPIDRRRGRATTGVIVHPRGALSPVFDRPGGNAFASLANVLMGYETWLPVIAYQSGWVRVLLPARPAGLSGWLDADGVTTALNGFEIRIFLRARRLHLMRDGEVAGIWPTEPGSASTRLAGGRTFLLSVRRDPRRREDMPVLPLAEPVPTSWSGRGCGTVGIHGGVTHEGCVGVPAGAMKQLAQVPAGTLVRLYT